MYQTHYAEPSSDESDIMGSFLAMSVNENANPANCKDCTKCPNKRDCLYLVSIKILVYCDISKFCSNI